MHASHIINKLLSAVMHKKRLNTLTLLVDSLFLTKKLSLTELGRGVNQAIQERSAIKKSDRFLGNVNLEVLNIYKELIKKTIGSKTRPWLVADWSEAPNSSNHILRIAAVADGRTLTIYEEVHPEAKLYNASVEKQFLKNLKMLLPKKCRPIIITDAGFHNHWFKQVINLGFDYVGRIRANKTVSLDNKKTWHSHKKFYKHASSQPKFIGELWLCQKSGIKTNVYTYKGKSRGRHVFNYYGERRRNSPTMKHRKSANDPWILVSSLKGRGIAKKVVKLYKCRMQIEESFRDLKSSRYGFSLEQACTKRLGRLQNLLIIAAVASYVAWIVGWVAEKLELKYLFQVNTTKSRRVLSLFYLGCCAIRKQIKIPISLVNKGLIRDFAYE